MLLEWSLTVSLKHWGINQSWHFSPLAPEEIWTEVLEQTLPPGIRLDAVFALNPLLGCSWIPLAQVFAEELLAKSIIINLSFPYSDLLKYISSFGAKELKFDNKLTQKWAWANISLKLIFMFAHWLHALSDLSWAQGKQFPEIHLGSLGTTSRCNCECPLSSTCVVDKRRMNWVNS